MIRPLSNTGPTGSEINAVPQDVPSPLFDQVSRLPEVITLR
jgi:hypothetical protein